MYFFYSCLHIGFLFVLGLVIFFFFKQKTAYDMRISDWSSDVCSSDLSPWSGGRPLGCRWSRGTASTPPRSSTCGFTTERPWCPQELTGWTMRGTHSPVCGFRSGKLRRRGSTSGRCVRPHHRTSSTQWMVRTFSYRLYGPKRRASTTLP